MAKEKEESKESSREKRIRDDKNDKKSEEGVRETIQREKSIQKGVEDIFNA